MRDNQVLLKGGHARKVLGEVADTRIILRDGLVVEGHRVILSSNPFLHQLVCSSWVAGENSTFLMPQHSFKDLLLNFSLPLDIFTNVAEPFFEVNELGEAEIDNETSSDSGEIKVEGSGDKMDLTSYHNKVENHPDNEDCEVLQETGKNINENSLLSGFEPILKQNVPPGFEKIMKPVETHRKRLQSESPPSKSPFGKRRKNSIEANNKQSSELGATDSARGDLNISGLVGHSDKTEDIDITIGETMASDDPRSVKSENKETETELETNLSSFGSGRTLFPLKNGKKGMMFTKDDEHEWHLFKLNSSKPHCKSDYYRCHRCTK